MIARRSFGIGRSSAGGSTWESFKKNQAKFGKDNNSSYRAAYEKETRERIELKLNWGIKNRWEQRALDDVMKNKDVRQA